MTNSQKNLNQLLTSGQMDNIELAFQIAQGLAITEEALLAPWRELIDLCTPHLRTNCEKETLFLLFTSKKLDLSYATVSKLPASISTLSHLEELHLYHSRIYRFPPELAQLKNLKRLFLAKTPITIQQMKQLNTLLPHCELYF